MSVDFASQWKAWQQAYKEQRKSYNVDPWDDVAGKPLDKVLDELGRMILGATPEQRRTIEKAIKERRVESWDLVLYVRRMGLRLQRDQERDLLDAVLAIAAMCSNYDDPRDVLVSLVLLVVGAKKAGISLERYTGKGALIPDQATRESLDKAYHQSERSVELTIRIFGPQEWKSPGEL